MATNAALEARWAALGTNDKHDLCRRFAIFCAGGNDNRLARITVDEAELLIWLAHRGAASADPTG